MFSERATCGVGWYHHALSLVDRGHDARCRSRDSVVKSWLLLLLLEVHTGGRQ